MKLGDTFWKGGWQRSYKAVNIVPGRDARAFEAYRKDGSILKAEATEEREEEEDDDSRNGRGQPPTRQAISWRPVQFLWFGLALDPHW